MMSNMPNPDEIQMVKDFDGDKKQLGVCEQFFLELSSVDDLQVHFELLLLSQTFSSRMEDITPPLNTMLSALDILQNNQHLNEILLVVLKTGNYINGGTPRGGAYGFKIETFSKLKELRSHKPGFTLLHYVVQTVYNEYPESASIIDEFSVVKDCLRFDLDTITKDMNNIASTFKKCQNYMPKAQTLVTKGDKFYPKCKEFSEQHQDEIQSNQKLIATINDKYKKTAALYAEDPSKTKMNEFIEIFADFISDFDRAKKDLDRMKADEEKRKKLEDLRARKPVVVKQRRSSKRGVLDLMMSNLEEGKAEDVKNNTLLSSAAPSQNDLMAAMALVRGERK